MRHGFNKDRFQPLFDESLPYQAFTATLDAFMDDMEISGDEDAFMDDMEISGDEDAVQTTVSVYITQLFDAPVNEASRLLYSKLQYLNTKLLKERSTQFDLSILGDKFSEFQAVRRRPQREIESIDGPTVLEEVSPPEEPYERIIVTLDDSEEESEQQKPTQPEQPINIAPQPGLSPEMESARNQFFQILDQSLFNEKTKNVSLEWGIKQSMTAFTAYQTYSGFEAFLYGAFAVFASIVAFITNPITMARLAIHGVDLAKVILNPKEILLGLGQGELKGIAQILGDEGFREFFTNAANKSVMTGLISALVKDETKAALILTLIFEPKALASLLDMSSKLVEMFSSRQDSNYFSLLAVIGHLRGSATDPKDISNLILSMAKNGTLGQIIEQLNSSSNNQKQKADVMIQHAIWSAGMSLRSEEVAMVISELMKGRVMVEGSMRFDEIFSIQNISPLVAMSVEASIDSMTTFIKALAEIAPGLLKILGETFAGEYFPELLVVVKEGVKQTLQMNDEQFKPVGVLIDMFLKNQAYGILFHVFGTKLFTFAAQNAEAIAKLLPLLQKRARSAEEVSIVIESISALAPRLLQILSDTFGDASFPALLGVIKQYAQQTLKMDDETFKPIGSLIDTFFADKAYGVVLTKLAPAIIKFAAENAVILGKVVAKYNLTDAEKLTLQNAVRSLIINVFKDLDPTEGKSFITFLSANRNTIMHAFTSLGLYEEKGVLEGVKPEVISAVLCDEFFDDLLPAIITTFKAFEGAANESQLDDFARYITGFIVTMPAEEEAKGMGIPKPFVAIVRKMMTTYNAYDGLGNFLPQLVNIIKAFAPQNFQEDAPYFQTKDAAGKVDWFDNALVDVVTALFLPQAAELLWSIDDEGDMMYDMPDDYNEDTLALFSHLFETGGYEKLMEALGSFSTLGLMGGIEAVLKVFSDDDKLSELMAKCAPALTTALQYIAQKMFGEILANLKMDLKILDVLEILLQKPLLTYQLIKGINDLKFTDWSKPKDIEAKLNAVLMPLDSLLTDEGIGEDFRDFIQDNNGLILTFVDGFMSASPVYKNAINAMNSYNVTFDDVFELLDKPEDIAALQGVLAKVGQMEAFDMKTIRSNKLGILALLKDVYYLPIVSKVISSFTNGSERYSMESNFRDMGKILTSICAMEGAQNQKINVQKEAMSAQYFGAVDDDDDELRNAILYADYSYIDIKSASFDHLIFDSAYFVNAKFGQLDINGSELRNCQFTGMTTDLAKLSIQKTTFDHVSFLSFMKAYNAQNVDQRRYVNPSRYLPTFISGAFEPKQLQIDHLSLEFNPSNVTPFGTFFPDATMGTFINDITQNLSPDTTIDKISFNGPADITGINFTLLAKLPNVKEISINNCKLPYKKYQELVAFASTKNIKLSFRNMELNLTDATVLPELIESGNLHNVSVSAGEIKIVVGAQTNVHSIDEQIAEAILARFDGNMPDFHATSKILLAQQIVKLQLAPESKKALLARIILGMQPLPDEILYKIVVEASILPNMLGEGALNKHKATLLFQEGFQIKAGLTDDLRAGLGIKKDGKVAPVMSTKPLDIKEDRIDLCVKLINHLQAAILKEMPEKDRNTPQTRQFLEMMNKSILRQTHNMDSKFATALTMWFANAPEMKDSRVHSRIEGALGTAMRNYKIAFDKFMAGRYSIDEQGDLRNSTDKRLNVDEVLKMVLCKSLYTSRTDQLRLTQLTQGHGSHGK